MSEEAQAELLILADKIGVMPQHYIKAELIRIAMESKARAEIAFDNEMRKRDHTPDSFPPHRMT